jgi:hypothetical protein
MSPRTNAECKGQEAATAIDKGASQFTVGQLDEQIAHKQAEQATFVTRRQPLIELLAQKGYVGAKKSLGTLSTEEWALSLKIRDLRKLREEVGLGEARRWAEAEAERQRAHEKLVPEKYAVA